MNVKLSKSRIILALWLLFFSGSLIFFELFAAMGLDLRAFYALSSIQSIILPFIFLQKLLETTLTNLYFRPYEAQVLFDIFRFVSVFLAWALNIIYLYLLSDLIILISGRKKFSKKLALIIIAIAIIGLLNLKYNPF